MPLSTHELTSAGGGSFSYDVADLKKSGGYGSGMKGGQALIATCGTCGAPVELSAADIKSKQRRDDAWALKHGSRCTSAAATPSSSNAEDGSRKVAAGSGEAAGTSGGSGEAAVLGEPAARPAALIAALQTLRKSLAAGGHVKRVFNDEVHRHPLGSTGLYPIMPSPPSICRSSIRSSRTCPHPSSSSAPSRASDPPSSSTASRSSPVW